MAHIKLLDPILMAHVCEYDNIQLKDMFQIVAMWLQFSTEGYVKNKYKPSLDMVTLYRTVPPQSIYILSISSTSASLDGLCFLCHTAVEGIEPLPPELDILPGTSLGDLGTDRGLSGICC